MSGMKEATSPTCPVRVARTCIWPQLLTRIHGNFTGYALADHLRVSLVVDALAHAHGVRGSLDGAVFHSDHGSETRMWSASA